MESFAIGYVVKLRSISGVVMPVTASSDRE